ncbi:MAG TPA: CvpA family protein [Candidatus Paceibacterota bacterium]|nr:CvpA family protein [Verrucomicrobiota bacterium]HRY47428.1 CvpA family protein [Candidatus Paceibacterota bacterium]HSA01087.1 CvpA family protein [Candidatus Paceibacterota bacterium]
MVIELFETVFSPMLAAVPGAPVKSQDPVFGWFDLVVVAVIFTGVWRGRQRGMSQELLDLLQWLGMVIGGGILYDPIGRALARLANMDLIYCFVVSYLGFALTLKLAFTLLKRSLGEKLVGSDVFGRSEYYLGMVAGGLRFLCVLIMVLAVMHAPQISEADRRATAKKQKEYFEDISFPTFGSIQYGIFRQSFSGLLIEDKASWLLIKAASASGQKRESIGQRRAREVESIIKP